MHRFARRSRGPQDRPEREATDDEPVGRIRQAGQGRCPADRQGDAHRRFRRVRGTGTGHRGADPRLRALDAARPRACATWSRKGRRSTVEVLNVDPATRRIGLSLKSIARNRRTRQDAAEQAEREADVKAAEELMANRPVNPNLRGGIGSSPIRFDKEQQLPQIRSWPRLNYFPAVGSYNVRVVLSDEDGTPACPCRRARRRNWLPCSTRSRATSARCSSASPRSSASLSSRFWPTGTCSSKTCRASARRCWPRRLPGAWRADSTASSSRPTCCPAT